MRGRINATVLGPTGAPLQSASIQVNIRGGAAAVVYNQEVGGTTVGNPLTTDAQGRVLAWVDRGAYDLVISGAGITTYTVNVEVVPGRDGGIDSSWIGAGVVQQTHLAAASVGNTQLAPGVGVPIGVSLDFNGPEANIDTGYLPEDGRAISRTTYSLLFGKVGTVHGSGDGSTTFNIPDSRGRVRVGKDDMGGSAAGRLAGSALAAGATTLGASGGEAAHAVTVAEMPSHGHGHTLTIYGGSHSHQQTVEAGGGVHGSFDVPQRSDWTAQMASSFYTQPAVVYHPTSEFGGSISNAGSGSAHNTVQPGRIVNTIIRVA